MTETSCKILFIALEFSRWREARSWSYEASLGLEEGFVANGITFLTVPALYELNHEDAGSWLYHLKEICRGRRFEQVWIEMVHNNLDETILSYIATLAPVRVALLGESLRYTGETYRHAPELRRRCAVVKDRLRFVTHVLAADEMDAEYLNGRGDLKALWWVMAIPARAIKPPAYPASETSALFSGALYGDRGKWLEDRKLQGLLTRQQPLEEEAKLPEEFDRLNDQVVTEMRRHKKWEPSLLREHLDKLRQLRCSCFALWLEGLARGSAVVNLPSFFQGYAGRVFEGMAAGRPVISWELPERPRTRALFRDGVEILLFAQDNPEQLSQQIRKIQEEPDLAARMAAAARRKMLKHHTVEHRVKQILDWVERGVEPDYGEKEEPATAPETTPNQEHVAPGTALPEEAPIPAHPQFFTQKIPVKVIPGDRFDLFSRLCAGKKVLHVGCTDSPIFDPENNLHIKLSAVCRQLDGLDVDTAGLECLRSYVPGRYFSHVDQVDDDYDLLLVPETIEHVDNVRAFLESLAGIRFEYCLITAPNAFLPDDHGNHWERCGNYVEYVHPDHNCWFSPHTLKNCIAKFTDWSVSETFLLNNQSMVACLCHRPQGDSAGKEKGRILISCTHFWPSVGGIETMVEGLGERLVQEGYEVEVATWSHPGRNSDRYRGITIISLDREAVREGAPVWVSQLRGLATSGNYRACILVADPLNPVIWSLEGAKIPSQTRLLIQPVINKDGFQSWRGDAPFRSRLAAILRKAVPLSLTLRGAEAEFMAEEGLEPLLIPNAVQSLPEGCGFRQRYGISDTSFLILHLANLWRVKNHIGLLTTLGELPEEFRLVMVGYPSEDHQYLSELQEELARHPRVLLIPGLPREEVGAALKAADLLVLASHGEVSPVSVLEAMSHRVPWLATPDCGAVNEQAGGVVLPLDAFPQAVMLLRETPALLKELGELGYRHWSACFSWKVVLRSWVDAIETGRLQNPHSMPTEICREQERIVRWVMEHLQHSNSRPLPLISVVIPCFNQAQFLPESLGSVLEQSWRNWECIVVDDGSPDDTSTVAGELIRAYPGSNIRLLQKENGGLADARNAGVGASSGEFVLFLDADDTIHPRFLEETAKLLMERPEVGFVYTDVQHFGARTDIWSGGPFNPQRLLRENQLACSALFRHRAFDEVGGLKPEMTSGFEDWEFWIALYRKGWLGLHLDKPYFLYRKYAEPSMLGKLMEDKTKTEHLKAQIIMLHQPLYATQEVEWATRTLARENPFGEPEMGIETLKSRKEVAQAREIMKKRGIDFLRPPADPEFTARGWLTPLGDEAKSWDVLKTVQLIEKRLPRDAALLDLGAFRCELLCALHQLGYHDLTGIDLNPELRRMPFSDRIRYVVGDYLKSSFADASFDAITAISVIEHGFDGPALLREVSRLLKPGGYFIASVDYWPEKIDTCGIEAFGMEWTIFSGSELQEFLQEAAQHDLAPLGGVDLTGEERTVDWSGRRYTFAWLALRKKLQPASALAPSAPNRYGGEKTAPAVGSVVIAHTEFAFSPTGVNSGAEMATLQLARELARLGVRVRVFAVLTTGSQVIDQVTFTSFPDHGRLCHALASESNGAQLLIANSLEALQAAAGNHAFVTRLFWMHAPAASYGDRMTVINRCADGVIHVSRFQQQTARRVGLATREILLYNGYSPQTFGPGQSRAPHQLIYAGALVPLKGVHILIAAFDRIKAAFPDATLLICGSSKMWGERPYLNEVQLAALHPGVRFLGAVPQAELAALFAGSVLGLAPTMKRLWQDPFPLTPVEMQACGLPVVVSAAGGLPESIEEGVTGFVLDSEQPEDWAEFVISLLGDQQRLESMRGNCVKRARGMFRWDQLAASFLTEAGRLHAAKGENMCGGNMGAGGYADHSQGNIAFLSTWNQPCGIATHSEFVVREIRELLAAQSTGDCRLLILAERGEVCGRPDEPGVFRCWHRNGDSFALAQEIIEQNNVAILHVQFHCGLYRNSGIERLLAACRQRGIKVFITFHSCETDLELSARLANLSERSFVHLQQGALRLIAAGAQPAKLAVLPHGMLDQIPQMEVQQARRDSGLSSSATVLSTFGFVLPHKGIREIIEALPRIQTRHPGCCLLVLGGVQPGNPSSAQYLESCRQLAKELGIAERVIFKEGFLPEHEVTRYLLASDCVILNYTWQANEISGAAAFALAHRRPVITSSAPGFGPLVDCTLQLSDQLGLAQACCRVLESETLKNYLADRTEAFIERHSFRELARLLVQAYGPLRRDDVPAARSHPGLSMRHPGLRQSDPPGERIRVLFDVSVLGLSLMDHTARTGVFRVVENLARGLARHPEIEVAFCSIHGFGAHAPELSHACRRYLAGSPALRGVPYYEGGAPTCDVYHSPYHPLATLPGCVRFIMIHDLAALLFPEFFEGKSDFSRQVVKSIVGDDWILCNSQATLNDVARLQTVPGSHLAVTHLAAERELFHPVGDVAAIQAARSRYGIPDAPYFLSLCTLEPRKNLGHLLTVFAGMVKDGSAGDANLVLVGNRGWGMERFDRKISELGELSGRVVLAGYVEDEDLSPLYSGALAFVYLSHHEGFGLPPLEAMQCGTPVIVSSNSSFPEVVGEAGIMLDPTDAAGLSAALQQMISDPELRSRLSRLGLERAAQFTWESCLEQTVAAYRRGVKERRDIVQEPAETGVSIQTPAAADRDSAVRRILWIRPDSIGDNVLAASMLPHLKGRYPEGSITVLCQQHIVELYQASPYVTAVIGFDMYRAHVDQIYRELVGESLKQVEADLALYSLYSRDPLYDWFTAVSGAKERVALQGDLSNTTARQRDSNNKLFTGIVESAGRLKPELERHRDFLHGIGIAAPALGPVIWIRDEEEREADDFFVRNNLRRESTVALFAGAQSRLRLYGYYGKGLADLCSAEGLTIVALGCSHDREINQKNLDESGAAGINLCGELTLRQSAAILKRCRMAVGAETGLAHMACAVGVPNVVLLGGGHFGRFMPYSPLTSVVCLPLDCYFCNWNCRYSRAHCVHDVNPAVIAEAVRQTLAGSSQRTRVFCQSRELWHNLDGGPAWKGCEELLEYCPVEIRQVGYDPDTGGLPPQLPVTLTQCPPDPKGAISWQRPPCTRPCTPARNAPPAPP